MSQYPPQPYPQQGPPMGGPPMGGPPMGGPPMYGPPPKKKGIVLLVLGLLTMIIGIVLVVVGVGAGANMVNSINQWVSPETTLIAPGEKTYQLEAGANMIIAWDSVELNGQVYAPSDQYPTNDTTLTVTDAQGTALLVENPGGTNSMEINNNRGTVIGGFETPAAGAYTLSVTGPGMDERGFTVLKQSDVMALVGGGVGIFAGVCGGGLAVIGLILLIVWVIVRK